jgi:hypothetical protein
MFASQFGKEHDLARPILFKGCNAVLEHPGGSLRASRETIVRGVAPLGKDWPCQDCAVCRANDNGENHDPARRALRPTVSQLAELINTTLTEYYYPFLRRRFTSVRWRRLMNRSSSLLLCCPGSRSSTRVRPSAVFCSDSILLTATSAAR